MTPGTPSHRPRKRFGQHFLHDSTVIERIVRAMDPKPGDAVVEIGPGLGALTRPLLERAGAVTVVEIDRDVIPHLRAACGGHPGLSVIQADALTVDFRALAHGRKLRLAGNLPYNISTPLLFHLLEQADCIEDMHFMLQKEVVDRMCAAPGGRDYGRLSVALAARCELQALFGVGRGAFRPPPLVASAVVRLRPRPAPFPITDPRRFDHVVRRAFAQRRKTLGNALRGVCTAEQIRAAGIDPGARAETLSAEQFARLANRSAGT